MMRMRVIKTIAAALLVVGLAGCGSGSDDEDGQKTGALEAAHEKCAAEDTENPDNEDSLANIMELGDDGDTITIRPSSSGAGELVTLLAMVCVLGATDAPDSVIDPISSTTPMMGRQSADWEGYSMVYSYAAGSGLNATITAE